MRSSRITSERISNLKTTGYARNSQQISKMTQNEQQLDTHLNHANHKVKDKRMRGSLENYNIL